MPLTPERIAELDAFYAQQGLGAIGGNVPLTKDGQLLDVFSPPQQTQPALSPERIAELDRFYAQQQPAQSPDGFLDRVGADVKRRKGQMDTIADQYVGGDISSLEANTRMGLKYAQLLPDVVGQGLVSGFRSLPDIIEQPIRKGAGNVYSAIADSPVGDIASSAINKYQDFAKEHPVAAGRLSSVADVGNLAAAFIPVKGTSAAAATGDALSGTAKVTGSALKKAGSAAVKPLVPAIDDGMRPVVTLAQKYKIPVAMHQVSQGPVLKNFQKVSKELPFSGDAAFRDKQMKALQRELIRTAGGHANKFTPELMDNLFSKVGKEFDDFGKGKVVNLLDRFAENTENLIMELEEIAPEAVGPAHQRIKKIFAAADHGIITGEKIAALRKETSRLARKTGNPDIASAFQDIENALVDSITVGDAAAAKAFAATKQKYKNLLVLEPLAQKAKGGNISPAQLQTRVAKIYDRSFTRGQAGEIGDLARIGHELLPELGGSDTTQKLAYLGTGTGLLANPGALPAVAGILTGNRIIQTGINRNQKLVGAALNKSRNRDVKKVMKRSAPILIQRGP